MSRVTMAEVAEAAGVNKATVSRALKGDPRISSETRQKVWEAAKRLGYQLDTVASGLSSRRTGVIGVVVENFRVPWLGSFLCGIHRVLSRYKMEFLLVEANEQETSVAHALRRLEGRKVDGLIWQGVQNFHNLNGSVPMISVGCSSCGECQGFHVDIEKLRTLDMIRSLAGERPVLYRQAQGMFPFLESLQGKGDGSPFVIWDGDILISDEAPNLICGDLRSARHFGVPCLAYPALELGLLAARVLTNTIRDRGVRPRYTLVLPTLLSPLGEPLWSEPSAFFS